MELVSIVDAGLDLTLAFSAILLAEQRCPGIAMPRDSTQVLELSALAGFQQMPTPLAQEQTKEEER